MWQEIIVFIIGIATAGTVFYKIFRLFTNRKPRRSPCDGCCGCPLGHKK
jgi:hypothetical protein